jgi:hypothetical protein
MLRSVYGSWDRGCEQLTLLLIDLPSMQHAIVAANKPSGCSAL